MQHTTLIRAVTYILYIPDVYFPFFIPTKNYLYFTIPPPHTLCPSCLSTQKKDSSSIKTVSRQKQDSCCWVKFPDKYNSTWMYRRGATWDRAIFLESDSCMVQDYSLRLSPRREFEGVARNPLKIRLEFQPPSCISSLDLEWGTCNETLTIRQQKCYNNKQWTVLVLVHL